MTYKLAEDYRDEAHKTIKEPLPHHPVAEQIKSLALAVLYLAEVIKNLDPKGK